MTTPKHVASGASATEAVSPAAPEPTSSIRVTPTGASRIERRNQAMGWRSRDVLRAAGLVAALYVTLQLLWFSRTLLLVAFLGVLFGLAVEAGVDQLQRFRIRRGVAAAGIVLGFFALLFGMGAAMAPTLAEQGRVLQQRLPEAVEAARNWIESRRSGFLDFFLSGDEAPGGAAPTQTAPPGTPGDTAAPDTVVAVVSNQPSLRDRITEGLGGATRFLFPFLSSTVAVFGGIVLIIFLAIYIGAEPDVYHGGLMHLFPHRSRQRAGEVLSAIALVLRKWLVTQLIAMASIFVVSTTVLLALKVPAALALGVIAGLLEFVPTVGPILSAIPAIAMGFVDSPEKALYVAFAYMGIQFLENNFLIPVLMRGGVNLAPAMTLMAQAVMTLVFGFLGLMVAVPILAAAMVPIKMLYVKDVVGDDVSILEEDDDS